MSAGLPERVHTWLDRHTADRETLALACSGGGDSVALLHLASDWAHRRGRRLHVLTVDHGLRPEAGGEAEFVRRLSARLGWPCQILNWIGDKPDTALQEQARHARHSLLANACAQTGITDLLLAHTRDDQAETVCMRLIAGGGWHGAAAAKPGWTTRPIPTRVLPVSASEKHWPVLQRASIWSPVFQH